jgi:undecaprenyl-diphosphatase
MSFVHVIILAVVQGLAELLPVSSSAHVVIAEKLMGMDPSSPEMTLLLVMLHTGTMFAVIVYFWKRWHIAFLQSAETFKNSVFLLFVATALTGLVGEALIKIIEKTWFHNAPNAEIEQLFSHLELIAPALAVGGILILIAGILERKRSSPASVDGSRLDLKHASLIGIAQGLCLPFRGFSRSGATISAGMLAGVEKMRAEDFSFALAVILTPVVDAREALRLIKAEHITSGASLASAFLPGMIGAVCAFLAGLLALKWLSQWLESGRWFLFGIYCLAAAVAVAFLYHAGY